MHLIDIDAVGPQPAQRVLDLPQDPRAAGVASDLAVLPFQADLGGDDHVLAQAALGKRLADDLLGAAEAVDRRRVDEIDAVVERGADGGDRFRLVGAAPHPTADRPGAERDARGLSDVPEFSA